MSRKIEATLILSMFLIIMATPLAGAKPDEVKLLVVELRETEAGKLIAQISSSDPAGNNHYLRSGIRWYMVAKYYINPQNKMGLATGALTSAITASDNAWDSAAGFTVLNYVASTSKIAGKYDRVNVVSFGNYKKGVIAVTYIWYTGDRIVETDCRMNTLYKWSLTGENTKMDVRNIMTHEFGHWCGLDDLYNLEDQWQTMYGYSNYGVTYQRTLTNGDVLGVRAVYGTTPPPS